jgi:hypothetical protein
MEGRDGARFASVRLPRSVPKLLTAGHKLDVTAWLTPCVPRAEDMDEDDVRPRRRRRVDEAQAGDLDDENDADVRWIAPPHEAMCRSLLCVADPFKQQLVEELSIDRL